MKAFRTRTRQSTWTAAAALLLLAPPVHEWLEATMARQMLLQFPLLALAGFVLAGALPARWSARLQACNAYGITGLLGCALLISLLMIPRLLDLALTDIRFEAAKVAALLACGAALRGSWRRAGHLVQGFFLGNVLPMMAVAGQLYQDSPLRLCNAYLLDDQVRLGQALVGLALAAAVAWLAQLFLALMRRDGGGLPPAPAR